ncbi:hypothetical protein FHG87_019342 [Trinorchestia longiramus]|nr:hypothetical protein FHG87_019342 [Trinorchestia longiramus]
MLDQAKFQLSLQYRTGKQEPASADFSEVFMVLTNVKTAGLTTIIAGLTAIIAGLTAIIAGLTTIIAGLTAIFAGLTTIIADHLASRLFQITLSRSPFSSPYLVALSAHFIWRSFQLILSKGSFSSPYVRALSAHLIWWPIQFTLSGGSFSSPYLGALSSHFIWELLQLTLPEDPFNSPYLLTLAGDPFSSPYLAAFSSHLIWDPLSSFHLGALTLPEDLFSSPYLGILSAHLIWGYSQLTLSGDTFSSPYLVAFSAHLIWWPFQLILSGDFFSLSYVVALSAHPIWWPIQLTLSGGIFISSHPGALSAHFIWWSFLVTLSGDSFCSSYMTVFSAHLIQGLFQPTLSGGLFSSPYLGILAHLSCDLFNTSYLVALSAHLIWRPFQLLLSGALFSSTYLGTLRSSKRGGTVLSRSTPWRMKLSYMSLLLCLSGVPAARWSCEDVLQPWRICRRSTSGAEESNIDQNDEVAPERRLMQNRIPDSFRWSSFELKLEETVMNFELVYRIDTFLARKKLVQENSCAAEDTLSRTQSDQPRDCAGDRSGENEVHVSDFLRNVTKFFLEGSEFLKSLQDSLTEGFSVDFLTLTRAGDSEVLFSKVSTSRQSQEKRRAQNQPAEELLKGIVESVVVIPVLKLSFHSRWEELEDSRQRRFLGRVEVAKKSADMMNTTNQSVIALFQYEKNSCEAESTCEREGNYEAGPENYDVDDGSKKFVAETSNEDDGNKKFKLQICNVNETNLFPELFSDFTKKKNLLSEEEQERLVEVYGLKWPATVVTVVQHNFTSSVYNSCSNMTVVDDHRINTTMAVIEQSASSSVLPSFNYSLQQIFHERSSSGGEAVTLRGGRTSMAVEGEWGSSFLSRYIKTFTFYNSEEGPLELHINITDHIKYQVRWVRPLQAWELRVLLLVQPGAQGTFRVAALSVEEVNHFAPLHQASTKIASIQFRESCPPPKEEEKVMEEEEEKKTEEKEMEGDTLLSSIQIKWNIYDKHKLYKALSGLRKFIQKIHGSQADGESTLTELVSRLLQVSEREKEQLLSVLKRVPTWAETARGDTRGTWLF